MAWWLSWVIAVDMKLTSIAALTQAFLSELALMTGAPTPVPQPTPNRTAIAATSTAGIVAVRTAVSVSADVARATIQAKYPTPTMNPTLAAALAKPAPRSGATVPSGPALRVLGTGGSGLMVRRTPGAERVASANEGELVADLGERQTVAGREWRRVRAPDGVEGWAAGEFLTAP